MMEIRDYIDINRMVSYSYIKMGTHEFVIVVRTIRLKLYYSLILGKFIGICYIYGRYTRVT